MDKPKQPTTGMLIITADNVELVVHNPPAEDLETSVTEKKNG